MKEVRQLIRWTIPGAISLVVFAVVLALGTDGNDLGDSPLVTPEESLETLNSFGGIAGLLVGAAVLGFAYAAIHHAFMRWVYLPWMRVDLRPALQSSRLVIKDYAGKAIDPMDLTCAGAWSVLNVAWHSSIGSDDGRIAGAEPRAQSMFDIYHGAGALMVGVFAASAFGVWVARGDALSVLIAAVLTVGVLLNVCLVARNVEAVVGGLILAVLPVPGRKVIQVERGLVCQWQWWINRRH